MTRRINLPVALLAATALLAAACGSSATPAPTNGGTGTGTTGPTGAGSQAPAGSAGAGASRAPGASGGSSETGAVTFGTAADNLDKLSSYKFSVVVQTVSVTKSSPAPTTSTTRTTMSGTVINSPTKSYSLTMDEDGDITGIIVIGPDAWIKEGSGYQQVPAAMAEGFAQTFASFRPEKLFALTFGINGNQFTRTGEESRNGVTTIHYKGSDSLNTIYGAMFGIQASFSSDAWIAKDGGYIVASEIKTSSASTAAGGSYSSVVNITDINSSVNKVDKPS